MSASPQATEQPEPPPEMTPGAFIDKWRASVSRESAGAQEHFIDLCRRLGEPAAAEAVDYRRRHLT